MLPGEGKEGIDRSAMGIFTLIFILILIFILVVRSLDGVAALKSRAM